MLSILSKIGPKFSVLVSTYHSRRLKSTHQKIPSLDSFTESLTHEQDKMIQMGALRASTNQALLAWETKNVQARRKQKCKEKKNIEFEPKKQFDPTYEASGSNKDKHQRFGKGKCSYCNKGNHTEKGCMKKTIDHMSRLLEQHNITSLNAKGRFILETRPNIMGDGMH